LEVFMALNDDDLIKMYRWMVLTRHFDQRVCDLQQQRGIPELQHASIGQEAVGVGACYGLRADDVVMPSLRTRAAFLVKGISPERQMAAMYGKANGAGHGKETSHHMGDPKLGVLAGSGVVGGSIPVAVGAALAFKLQSTDRVAMVFFGDGASNRGDFHESMNLAGVMKLPTIFVCENNLYALSMAISRHLPIANVADRAAGYGMPGVVVDGNDVVAVHDAAENAIARARVGEGPTLIECKTYRWRGHSERDVKQVYRTQDEVEKFKAFCPIKRLRDLLTSSGALNQSLIEEIDREVDETVDRAIDFAERSPNPIPEEALTNVYATGGGALS
jgi:TPP-dependent pyruvate/acetoin dehydrogenase alpha subunit